MAKNIVVCCDGTGNEFGAQNSNVIKLYQSLICGPLQIAYYHPGVGTMGARNALTSISKNWTKVLGLAFGYGISDNVADAYQFLMHNHEDGDRVYVFGFSRGAYTARALCGFLHLVGLIRPGNEGLIPYAIRMAKAKHIDFRVADDFKKTFSRICKPHFVGVWDTVSSVGWVYEAVRFPFVNAAHNPDFNIIRHAVSIDEHRAFFRQNLFGTPHPGQDVQEVWFSGVHADVGGSYPQSESGLAQIALRWMACEAMNAGLRVEQARLAAILNNPAPDPKGMQHDELKAKKAWWICEFWPKLVHTQNAQGTWHEHLRMNLGRRRYINPGINVHESVEQRLKAGIGYEPKNLPPQRVVVQDRCRAASANA